MKKILLIAIMAIVTTGVFAASFSKTPIVKTGEGKIIKKNIVQNESSVILYTCCKEAAFFADCPNGGRVLIAVCTISYNCDTQRIINTDVWQSGNSCLSQP